MGGRLLVACLVAGTGIGTIGVSQSSALSVPTSLRGNKIAATEPILSDRNQAQSLLEAASKIPDEVLAQGDSATQKWVSQNLLQNSASNTGGARTASFLGCSGAILATIGSTAIPAAKILRIKRYMEALGGTWEAIRILWGASFSYEKLQALGGTAAALGAELLGITAIKNACT